MRGPIDFIIVGFEGNKFNGSILNALSDALDKGVIGLVALSLIVKDQTGNVTSLSIEESGDEYVTEFIQKYKVEKQQIDQDDIDEIADLIENNCSAGLLAVEHLWAKPLKKAIIDTGGVLIADGRIHTDAAKELN
jgi:hypothetical protein